MPEGLSLAFGSRPRVTARWMIACFCSFKERDEPLLRADQLRRPRPMPIQKPHDQPLVVERRIEEGICLKISE